MVHWQRIRSNIILSIFGILTAAFSVRPDSIIIRRLSGPVTLDGLITESAWENIEPLPMTMYMPTFGNPPTLETRVLLGYDDSYFYIAGYCYDDDALATLECD